MPGHMAAGRQTGIWKRRVCEAGLSDERATAREAENFFEFSALECTRKINLPCFLGAQMGLLGALSLPPFSLFLFLFLSLRAFVLRASCLFAVVCFEQKSRRLLVELALNYLRRRIQRVPIDAFERP